MMWFLLGILGVLCMVLGFVCVRNQSELRSIHKQLEEIQRGSHMELTVNSRQRPLLALCRILNLILASKDKNYIQYEKAEKRLKQNIAGLAHDIRTPLTGAAGYVQLARECENANRRESYLRIAGMRLNELEDMLEEMFLYTKLTGEDFSLSMEKIQVLPLLSDCLLSLYARFEEIGTSPEVFFESEGLYVQADEEALRRIFLNLIQNALIHGTGGLSVTQRGNCITFENPVPDDIHPNPEQLFDKFYKSDPARRKGSSGLGLFIVKELAEKMGGSVEAELDGNFMRIKLWMK